MTENPHGMNDAGRRRALRSIGGLAALWAWPGAWAVQAASHAEYRALVCVFLFGGNDGNNLIVPLDNERYRAYRTGRRSPSEGGLSLDRDDLIALDAAGGPAEYGLHPAMGSLGRLWRSGQLSLALNVGAIDGSTHPTASFVGPTGVQDHGLAQSAWGTPCGGQIGRTSCGLAGAGFEIIDVAHRERDADPARGSSPGSPIVEAFASLSSPLSVQLASVASSIQAAASTGRTGRQLFFVSVGGFDSHSDQLVRQESLLQDLAESTSAFYTALQSLGRASDVTLFTASEFGRTLRPSQLGGSDHGWGNHHLVMGGAVQDRQVRGVFPDLALGGSDDAGQEGRWRPTMTMAEYTAPLAQWFGV